MERSPLFSSGRTVADIQELEISPLVRLRLKIEAIGLAITFAAAFKKKGSILSGPVDFLMSSLEKAFYTWEGVIVIKLKQLEDITL